MKHYGDITKLSGHDLQPVDIITGGSPCQDLSVAGKRAGLSGERSGLFMEQMRIIKEMREATGGKYPRYMVWENVPGALSSNEGEDFRVVIEETARIKDSKTVIPRPSGKWAKAGAVMGDGWSIAWRVHDAQFWGVPQRRKRIALVADFAGGDAPKILFERKSVPGNSSEGAGTGEETAGDVRKSFEKPSGCLTKQDAESKLIVFEDGVAFTINSRDYKDPQAVAYSIGAFYSEGMLSDNPDAGIKETDVARTLDLNGGSPTSQQGGIAIVSGRVEDDVVGALCARDCKGIGNQYVSDGKLVVEVRNTFARQSNEEYKESEVSSTLAQRDYKSATDLVVLENHPVDSRVKICEDDVFQTLSSRMGTGGGNVPMVMQSYVVRRLTPLECERLQGYPDGWTDIGEWMDSKGKKHKDADAPRYKALGNSIALPFWKWMAARMVVQCGGGNVTMGSLFDGIGGFPLVFQRCGAVPVWASEIEEFCIAVTKERFGNT